MTISTPITIFTVYCGNKQFLDMEPNVKFQMDGESCAIVNSWSNFSTSATTIGTEKRIPVPPNMPFLQITTAHKCKLKSR